LIGLPSLDATILSISTSADRLAMKKMKKKERRSRRSF
jgi:hypothetical protein